jgi:FMN reductase
MTPTIRSGDRLTVVLGSVTHPGRLHRAVQQALSRAAERHGGLETELIDLASRRIAFADGRSPPELGDDTEAVIAAIDAGTAVVLATPVYRGSLTGALKNLLDHVPVEVLRDKPVGVVAMGASDHHYLGVERHLRDVLSFFGALVVPTAAYLTGRDFDQDGRPGQRAQDELDAVLASATTLGRAVAEVGPLGPLPLVARPRG